MVLERGNPVDLGPALSFFSITDLRAIYYKEYVCMGIRIGQGLAANTRIKFKQKGIYNVGYSIMGKTEETI